MISINDIIVSIEGIRMEVLGIQFVNCTGTPMYIGEDARGQTCTAFREDILFVIHGQHSV